MSQNTKTDIADGAGGLEPAYVYPDGPFTAVFNITAGAANLEVSCAKVEDIRTGGGEPMWTIVAAAVIATPQLYAIGTKVSAVRLVNVGGIGTLQVAWKN